MTLTQRSLTLSLPRSQSLLSPPATNIQPLPEYKTAVAERSKWVLSHYGAAKTCWDVLVLLATIFVAIAVPLNAAFHEPGRMQCSGTGFALLPLASGRDALGLGERLLPAHHLLPN